MNTWKLKMKRFRFLYWMWRRHLQSSTFPNFSLKGRSPLKVKMRELKRFHHTLMKISFKSDNDKWLLHKLKSEKNMLSKFKAQSNNEDYIHHLKIMKISYETLFLFSKIIKNKSLWSNQNKSQQTLQLCFCHEKGNLKVVTIRFLQIQVAVCIHILLIVVSDPKQSRTTEI